MLGDIGDILRFPSAARFASCNGTAPIGASSGDYQRHRLSRKEIGASTGHCTSWPSYSCAMTPPATPTTDANSPREKPRWKRCAGRNDACPAWSTNT
ncbi:transposase [Nocardia transvalensis]|uniref:transposase n=1 Tax=Nocardia transvalensis TaxID=37333 RepID=UPI003A5CF3F9